jgi:uncharacterized protein (TIGR02466 family)
MIVNLFPVPIYKTKYNNLTELAEIRNSDLVRSFPVGDPYTQGGHLNGDAQSSSGSWKEISGAEQVHNSQEFVNVSKFIETHAKIYWDELDYFPDVYPKIYQSWLTCYHKGSSISIHNHGRARLVCVVYLDANPEQGNIVFENPMELLYTTQPYSLNYLQKNKICQEIEVNTGDVIIFPSWLKHYTLPNNTDKDRIILTSNLNDNGNYYNPHTALNK